MKFATPWIAVSLIVCGLLRTGYAQTGSISGGSASVVNGRVTLNGDFTDLRNIAVQSAGGHLAIGLDPDSDIILLHDTAPFPSGSAFEIGPERISIGQNLGIDVSGESKSGIQYAGPLPSLADDLQLSVRVGLCDPTPVPFGSSTDFTCDKVAPPVIESDPFYSIVDGRVTLHGKVTELTSVRVTSPHSSLSLADGAEILLDSKTPFPPSATVVTNEPKSVVIGVLGAENRITIEGPIKTGILYSQSDEFARSGDLVVNLGIASDPPLPIQPYLIFQIVDGAISLNVDRVEGLAGIEALSSGGHLSLATLSVPIDGLSTSPFSADSSRIAINTSSEVLIQSLGSQHRSISGVTPTGIVHEGPESSYADLIVTVTAANGETATLSYVPEPVASSLGFIACLAIPGLRAKRRAHNHAQ